MKLLLDENLPHGLRPLLMVHHDVFTVSYLKWKGIENGELLALAAANGFDALITSDRAMECEQDPTSLPCAVIVLKGASNRIEDLRVLVPRVLVAIRLLQPKTLIQIS